MTTSLGGLDVLVFTGSVGEHAAADPGAGRQPASYLGVRVDQGLNSSAEPDADISAAEAAARTLVVTSREDLEIAGGVERLLDGVAPGPVGAGNSHVSMRRVT